MSVALVTSLVRTSLPYPYYPYVYTYKQDAKPVKTKSRAKRPASEFKVPSTGAKGAAVAKSEDRDAGAGPAAAKAPASAKAPKFGAKVKTAAADGSSRSGPKPLSRPVLQGKVSKDAHNPDHEVEDKAPAGIAADPTASPAQGQAVRGTKRRNGQESDAAAAPAPAAPSAAADAVSRPIKKGKAATVTTAQALDGPAAASHSGDTLSATAGAAPQARKRAKVPHAQAAETAETLTPMVAAPAQPTVIVVRASPRRVTDDPAGPESDGLGLGLGGPCAWDE